VFQGRSHCLVHALHITSLNKVWGPAIPEEELLELLVTDSCEDGRIVDLVSVEVEYWEDGTISDRIEEFGAVPTSSKRTRLSLSISNHCQRDQIGVIKDRSEGVRNRVTKLSSLVNATWGLGSRVTTNSTGERKLLEEPLQAFLVFCYVGIYLRVGPFEVGLRDDCWGSMAGARNEEGI
jgi:hypothetical protein